MIGHYLLNYNEMYYSIRIQTLFWNNTHPHSCSASPWFWYLPSVFSICVRIPFLTIPFCSGSAGCSTLHVAAPALGGVFVFAFIPPARWAFRYSSLYLFSMLYQLGGSYHLHSAPLQLCNAHDCLLLLACSFLSLSPFNACEVICAGAGV